VNTKGGEFSHTRDHAAIAECYDPLVGVGLEVNDMRRNTAALFAGLALAGPATGHHSWSVAYDLGQSARISGAVSRVQYQSPHSALFLDVETAAGKTERWIVEWASPSRLRERGITEHTIKRGDLLVIDGNPHRNPATKSLRLQRLLRGSDGFAYP
jgi:hypothetical protein